MLNRSLLVGAGLLIALCGTLSHSQAVEAAENNESAPAFTVGSPAPRISVDRWLKGAPVYTFERGRVYVVEFWATWCTPCIASVPHLTDLQKKYPNITVIGVTASEQPSRPNFDDRLTKAEEFVRKQGANMDYTVAYDGAGFMWANWMVPAQRGGIPCTFIIGADGKISWIGHPLLDEFDRELEAAVNQPGVTDKPSNWRAAPLKAPVNTTITTNDPAKRTPAPPPAKVTSSQPTKVAPAGNRLPPAKPAPAKQIATGPAREDSSTPR